MNKMYGRGLLAALPLLSVSAFSAEFETSGKVALEQRLFFDDGAQPGQLNESQTSFMMEPELFWDLEDGQATLTFKPFYRYDAQDSERSHFDIRELAYNYASDDWELRLGIRKEFWGVTEFQHLVDVINQTDGVESFDGEEKLGQPMVNLSLVKDWGIVDIYLLTGFRDRTFAGQDGRLRAPLVVSDNNISYESSAKEQHLDLALRWSHSIGDMDLASYVFSGTNRDPYLTPKTEADGNSALSQHYSQMQQFGFESQLIVDDWLWKLEAIYRDTGQTSFWASQAGFEYSYVGVFDTDMDLGWLMEYGWDSRGKGSLTEPSGLFQNDLFLGSRLALNDAQSSELLMGFGVDLDQDSTSFMVEGSRRFGESLVASLDIRLFDGDEPLDPLSALDQDDHFQLSIEWFF